MKYPIYIARVINGDIRSDVYVYRAFYISKGIGIQTIKGYRYKFAQYIECTNGCVDINLLSQYINLFNKGLISIAELHTKDARLASVLNKLPIMYDETFGVSQIDIFNSDKAKLFIDLVYLYRPDIQFSPISVSTNNQLTMDCCGDSICLLNFNSNPLCWWKPLSTTKVTDITFQNTTEGVYSFSNVVTVSILELGRQRHTKVGLGEQLNLNLNSGYFELYRSWIGKEVLCQQSCIWDNTLGCWSLGKINNKIPICGYKRSV